MANFVIPEDYQKRILEAHRKLEKAYSETEDHEKRLKASLKRLKEQYRWGHISQREYLKKYKETEAQLRQLAPGRNGQEELERLAHFLADAWREANQEQRNELARVLFEEVRLDNGGKVVAVKPQPELEPFFQLNYDEFVNKVLKMRPRGDLNLMLYFRSRLTLLTRLFISPFLPGRGANCRLIFGLKS